MHRDSLANTIVVAVGVCLVCSFLVTAAAVGLRPIQEENVKCDIMKNILIASGVEASELTSNEKIKTMFGEKVTTRVIDLRDGSVVNGDEEKEKAFIASVAKPEQELDFAQAVEEFDPIKASEEPGKNEKLGKKEDVAGLKTLEHYSKVFIIPGEESDSYVFPIRGRGLWSTLKGFIALESDFNTVKGLTYYEHKETPGLGGEVDNPTWKAKWPGKSVFKDGDVKLTVIKGTVTAGDPGAEYEVDGLSGATITSNGVSKMLAFWFSEAGFKPYIDSQKK